MPGTEYSLRKLEDELMMLPINAAQRCRSPDAVRHLRHGLNRRALFMKENRFRIGQLVSQVKGAMGVYAVSEVNIHVNSYYVHAAGSLDNLAWALNYELSLFPNVKEDGKGRFQIELFRKEYIAALRDVLPAAADSIAAASVWATDLRTFRDPVAHRIPLYVPPAVLDEREAEQVRVIHAEAEHAFEAGNSHAGVEALDRAARIGTFRPTFIRSHAGGKLEFVDLTEQLATDLEGIGSVIGPVLAALSAHLAA